MKKTMILLSGFLLFLISTAWADTLYLKNGRTLQGDIILESKYSVKIMVNGVPKVFYADEIDKVEKAQEEAPSPQRGIITGEVSAKKKELILRFLSANGALESIRSTLRSFVGQLSPEKQTEFEGFLNADSLVDVFIPIYGKYYTEEELKQMIRFYSSSAGQRTLEVTPKIMEESIQASIEYFKKIEGGAKAE